jgi:hypothetical protein
MGIVTPPRGSKGAAPFPQKSGAGSSASGGIVTNLPRGSKGAKPNLNGGSFSPSGAYGSAAAGPYNPSAQKQSTRSSSAPLH